ncbi:hypothetical protein CCACVL1_16606 [Corchorus capsularis]|uniref:Uncharacterized protein n=1 Tax=Corchorus capsularis TaxID=210143 RepID=A0A1R3HW36_COCAP|nr:hypothetical protein CCACVL1_16606 [Corchorus capsularis]
MGRTHHVEYGSVQYNNDTSASLAISYGPTLDD